MSAKLVRKITPSTICVDELQRMDVPGAPAEKILYDVYGMAHKTKTGSTDYGEWIAFKGDFEAITPDGEIFRSGTVHVQEPFQEMLLSALQNAKQADENGSIQFAARVSIVPPRKGKPSATGYEYRVTPLVEAADSSPMLSLREKAQQAAKSLPAPDKVTHIASDTRTKAKA